MKNNSVSTSGMIRAQAIQVTRQPGQLLGIAGAVVLLVFIAALSSVAFMQNLDSEAVQVTDRELREIPGYGFVFAQLLLGSTIITLVTTEWASGSILGTIATTQRRAGLVFAKSVVGVAASAVAMVVGAASCFGVASAVLSTKGRGLDLTSSLQQQHLLGLVVAGCLSTLMAVGIAFAVRRTALAIVSYIALVIVAPIAFGLVPWDPMQRIASILPMNASGYMIATGPAPETGLTVPQAYLVMLAWVVVALAAGTWRITRTDI